MGDHYTRTYKPAEKQGLALLIKNSPATYLSRIDLIKRKEHCLSPRGAPNLPGLSPIHGIVQSTLRVPA
jgi:hypothetical protein